ncbi:hypothetical protein SAMN04487970_10593 [Paenibacillus tianmuensis]|uniref:Fibronectin type-III domain-containing protein n=1 Tax=Paenibacillus tianmuensis TaxID=624147 RepID=A0A1G4TMW4_9BACL|nr:hypothetical protein [Paenibacillus tianmuensis]SCW82770.1 hypothetical protein SAMN04487970_10593 [Paenibacillus tianmuensis]
MKRKTSLLLSMIMLIVLFSSVPAFAYQNGLLHGKQMAYGYTLDQSPSFLRTEMTDGNESSYVALSKQVYAWHKFDKVKTINSIKFLVNSNIDILFYDDSKNVIYKHTYVPSDPATVQQINLPSAIANVKTVAIYVPAADVAVHEFDVFENGINVPGIPSNLTAKGGDATVTLDWNSVTDAKGYNIKRATTPGGPYTIVASGVYGTTYTDTTVTNGTTYYYVVRAVTADGESADSNEASATPQRQVTPPSSGRAILVVTLDTGLEKEFDLSMTEVNSFIAWFEGKAAGTGTASYAIDKHENNKGPFKSRKDYVIFDKILTYEVNEYTLVSK